MFPKSLYLPFDRPIPAPPDDLGALCFTLDAKWQPYLVGLLKTLLIARTWEGDQERATGEASLLLEAVLLADYCVVEQPGAEVEDCMGCCLRVQDGHLQSYSCGVWADIPGGDLLALIGENSGAPSSGGEIPPDESSSACFDVPGIGFAPYPAAVGPGYKIELVSVNGQWSDGVDTVFGVFDWYCGDGAPSLFGACAGVKHTDSGDPLPTHPHMCVIAKIEPDIILDLTNGPVIIPSTATGNVLQLQANDSVTSDNAGSVHVCLRITNGSSHDANLTLDTSDSSPEITPFSSTVGKTYKITISGRGVVGSGPTSFDAFYYDVSGSPVRATTSGSACGFSNILQLSVDDHEFSPIPAFDASDVYVCHLLGTGAPFAFMYCDSNYTDNHGTLGIMVEEQAGP